MAKEWTLAMGEPVNTPVHEDSLLSQTRVERERRRVSRQEELEEIEHQAKLAKFEKEKASAQAAVEKTAKPDDNMGFKVTGQLNIMDLISRQVEDIKALKEKGDEQVVAMGRMNEDLRRDLEEKKDQLHQFQLESIKSMIASSAPRGTIIDQYREFMNMASEFGLAPPEPQGAADLKITLELERMKFENSLRLREMDRRDREADREFQRMLKKDEFDMEIRREEIQEKRRQGEIFAQAPAIVGATFARAIMDSGDQPAPITDRVNERVTSKPSYQLEAGLGEGGVIECPSGCGSQVAIGPTARQAICAKCGAKMNIKRKQTVPEMPDEEEE